MEHLMLVVLISVICCNLLPQKDNMDKVVIGGSTSIFMPQNWLDSRHSTFCM